MDTRTNSGSATTHRSIGNNPVIRNLRLRAAEMMRALQTSLDKVFLGDLNKLHSQMQNILEKEERKPQAGTSTLWSLERARLEKKISVRNEKEALRTTEYEEKEEDLKDKLDLHHDKIMESERHHNNAILDNVVKDTSLDIRIRAVRAEIDAIIESRASSCWSLFCCVPADVKQKRNELQALMREAAVNRTATDAADASKAVTGENAKRDKTVSELNALADSRVTAYDSDSDRDEEKLADVKFLMDQAKKNQSHVLSNEAMMACIRFYEWLVHINDHQSVETVKTILDSYIGDDYATLIRLLKEFYIQDADGLTTTFTELHDIFLELVKHTDNNDRVKLLGDDSLQDKLLGTVSITPRL